MGRGIDVLHSRAGALQAASDDLVFDVRLHEHWMLDRTPEEAGAELDRSVPRAASEVIGLAPVVQQ